MANARARTKEHLDVGIKPEREGIVHRTIELTLTIISLTFAAHSIVMAAIAAAQTSAPRVIEVSAKKYEFTPAEIHVKKGERVELKLHSADEAHGIKIDVYPEGPKDKTKPGLLFDHPETNGKVEKNVDQVLDFIAAEPGSYDFKCAKLCGMGHRHMQGKLIVEP
jgi:cytochrome c oxidase subunit 2